MSYEKECYSSRLRNPLILREHSGFYRKSVTAGIGPPGNRPCQVNRITRHTLHRSHEFLERSDLRKSSADELLRRLWSLMRFKTIRGSIMLEQKAGEEAHRPTSIVIEHHEVIEV